ncbi:hypothetical protein L1987_29825 [Smallanthus sonchifolius]|uniref:Uncharacterized protein n=1 Tax=Smallanthus sonchifolius TaxID=185202 RepID=A0ACB9I0Y6_9ASTR|nr:hypothetical protein L1987_29825 [Smallanthus sonchifolius]
MKISIKIQNEGESSDVKDRKEDAIVDSMNSKNLNCLIKNQTKGERIAQIDSINSRDAKKQSRGRFSVDGAVDLLKLISGWSVKKRRSGSRAAEVNDRRNREDDSGCVDVDDVIPNEG